MTENIEKTTEIETLIVNKKEEITKITQELKNHYYKSEFFVDPEKTFINLLERITNFFEDDYVILTMKENENLKEKYKKAINYVKKVDQKFFLLSKKEKKLELMQENLRLMTKEANANNSFCENESNINSNVNSNLNSPLGKIKNTKILPIDEESEDDFLNISNNNYIFNDIDIDNLSLTENVNNQLNNFEEEKNEKIYEIKSTKIKKKLRNNTKKNQENNFVENIKDEYYYLISEKNKLEIKVSEMEEIINLNKEIKSQNEALLIQNEILQEKNLNLNSENRSIIERNNKITKENYDLNNTCEQLKTSINYLEKERTLKKNQINANFNRVKLYEKENNTSKKKLNTAITNLKNLNNKLLETEQKKILLEKRMEDMKQDYENTITNLLLEQQKMQKDSFITTLKSLEEKKIPLEFIYEEDKNSLVIMLEDLVIGEFPNFKNSNGEIEKNKDINQNSNKKSIKNSPFKSSFSSSQSNKDNPNFDLNSVNSIGSKKNNNVDLETMLSLNKVLSGSSKKSFSTKRIFMSNYNFSSSKKNSQFIEENYMNSNHKFGAPSDFSNINYQSNFYSMKNPANFNNASNKNNERYSNNNNLSNNFNVNITNNFNNEAFNSKKKEIIKSGKRKTSLNENNENFDPNVKINKFHSIIEKSEENKNLINDDNQKKKDFDDEEKNKKNLKNNQQQNRKAINHKFESCIKNIDIKINTQQINDYTKNDIKKYLNSSTTNRNHKRVISLDEVLKFEDFNEKEIFGQTEKNLSSNFNINKQTIQENTKKFNFEKEFIDDMKTKGIFIEEEKDGNYLGNYDSEMQAILIKESVCEKNINLITKNEINIEISGEKIPKIVNSCENFNFTYVNKNQNFKKSFASKDLEIANGFDFNLDEFNFSQIIQHKNTKNSNHKAQIETDNKNKYRINYDFDNEEQEKKRLIEIEENFNSMEYSNGKGHLDLADENYGNYIANTYEENYTYDNNENVSLKINSNKKKRRTAHYSKNYSDYQKKINKIFSKEETKTKNIEEKNDCFRCNIL